MEPEITPKDEQRQAEESVPVAQADATISSGEASQAEQLAETDANQDQST